MMKKITMYIQYCYMIQMDTNNNKNYFRKSFVSASMYNASGWYVKTIDNLEMIGGDTGDGVR